MHMNMENMEFCQPVTLQMTTHIAVNQTHSAVWERETVTRMMTVLEPWFVAPTTVQLAEQSWIVVRVSILQQFINLFQVPVFRLKV